MAAQVRVTGAAVVLAAEAGGDVYLYRGAVVGSEEFTADSVKHALAVGLIQEVKAAPARGAKAKAAADADAADAGAEAAAGEEPTK